MKYTPENYLLLKDALIACNKHLQSHPEVEDKASVNFDTNTIDFTGWRQITIEKLGRETGVRIGNKLRNWIWKGKCFIFFDIHGQAGERTYFISEADRFLKERGIECSIYYGLD